MRKKGKDESNDVAVYCAYDEMVDIEKVVPNPRNPNKHNDRQIDLLAKIIRAQGWRNPITVSTRSGFIVRGHGRLLAARKLGLDKVPVDYQEYANEAEEWADLIADNRIAELAERDEALLKDILEELDTGDFDIELTGYTIDEIEKMMTAVYVPEEIEEDDFDVEAELEQIKEPETKPGDVWILGRHRLICGDCTDPEVVKKLMGGVVCNSMVTDPPYGVDYSEKNEFLNQFDNGNRAQTPIRNDAIENYREFFGAFLKNAPLAEYNTAYIFMSGKELHSLRLALDDAGYTCGDYLIWVKNNHVLGRKDYNAKHEFIVYGWKGKHKFYGPSNSTTVLEYDKPLKSELHPTMKPVPLVARLITDGSPAKGKVYDPFAGSGTTIIAAEQTGRTAYCCEIDPVYCDVIVQRWEQYTGQRAERE